jgi:hypothetical protein
MPLPQSRDASGEVRCTLCGARNRALAFPAILAAPGAAGGAAPALGGEAACFDHPNKRAEAACQHCGRYLCRLCSVEFGTEIWCPSCVAGRSGAAKAANPETSRTLSDSIVLTLPLASLLLWPLTAIAAPAALAVGAARWKRPTSLVRRWRWRMPVGMALALVEAGLWTWGILYLAARSGMAGK